MNSLSKVTPAAVAGIGFVLPLVNPKFLILNAAAGLAKVKLWLDRHHAPLTAVIPVVVGIVLLFQGIRAL